MGKGRLSAVALVAGSLLLVGCSSSGSASDSSSAPSAVASAAASSASSESAESYKVGVVSFSAADQTSSLAIKGLVESAPENWDVTVVDPQGSADKAVAAMENLIQSGVDVLVTTVFDSASLGAGISAAKSAGIPVISYAGGLADGVQVTYDGGYTTGVPIAEKLVSDMGGKGEVLVLGYTPGLPCVGREKALMEALEGTDITITREEVPIPGQVEASTKFTQAWLAQHPETGDGLAVWGCFDDPSLGAISAIKQADRSDIKVYGINGQPAALQAVKDGDMEATVFLTVYEAGKAIAEQVPSVVAGGIDAQQQELAIPYIVVTADNLEQFLKDYPTAMTG